MRHFREFFFTLRTLTGVCIDLGILFLIWRIYKVFLAPGVPVP